MHTTARWLPAMAWLLTALGSQISLAQEKPPAAPIGTDRLVALDRISADSLKGHLSFLASDLLEGRDTPSRGLDLAAEYIAAQFRRAGLEPVGDDGYFQTANWEMTEPAPSDYLFEVASDGKSVAIERDNILFLRSGGLDLPVSTTVKIDLTGEADFDPASLAGKVVLVEIPGPNPRTAERVRDRLAKLGQSAASLVISISKQPRPRGAGAPGGPRMGGAGTRQLIDPTNPRPVTIDRPGPPSVTVFDPRLIALCETLPDGPTGATVKFHLALPVTKPVKLRNVAGLLRGSDPALKDTYVLVTAHYDHLGIRGPEGGDRIFNGANDDGSGTVSVIELASAIATLKERPKRSILFMTFFGEEKGLLGSRYYGKHPLVPVEKTVADINLEQVGRTDDKEGARVGAAALTGFGYSEVSKVFVASGELEGIQVVKHPQFSDMFFGRSDNQALADLGVPAHTLCVAFDFPDYHGASDHWDKIDYTNMARIDRVVARTLLTIADNSDEPKWDESNPRAAKYLKAWKERHAK